MNRAWERLLHTVIAGTHRQPLPGDLRDLLGVPPAAGPEAAALYALAAAGLLEKAAAPDATATAPHAPCPPDERPLCPPKAAQDLRALLAGVFPDVLPEFFSLLAQYGFRLPPEMLPPLLDRLARQRTEATGVLDQLRPLGPWLAAQNAEWTDLYAAAPALADWPTASFAQRRALLAETRRDKPLVGLALLEKTWPGERTEHKLQFLETLRTGLSGADEALLERAAADKNHTVRRAALQLALLLPESGPARQLEAVLSSKNKTFRNPAACLAHWEKSLPDDGPLAKLQLTVLLPAVPAGSAGRLAALLALAPPDSLARHSGHGPAVWLEALGADPLLEALLAGIVAHRDGVWAHAALLFLETREQHPLWTSDVLAELLGMLNEAAWQAAVTLLCRRPALLERTASALVRTLETSEFSWPKAVLEAVVFFPAQTRKSRHWQPDKALAALLHRAALRCRPADAEAFEIPEGQLPYAWHGQLMNFRAVAAFRRRLHEHFRLPAN